MNPELLQKIKSPSSSWMPGPRTLLRLTGADRLRFLNGQVTQDIKKLPSGHAARSAITSSKGRLEADLHIAATPDSLLIETDFSLHQLIRSRIEKFIVADDVILEDISSSYTLAHLPTLSSPPTDTPKNALCFLCSRFRQPGLDIWIPTTSTWRPNSSPLSDWEPLRISRGLPLWGVDVGPDTLPPEAGFESDAISSTKGCYIGQEVMSRLRSVGHVNRHLCVLGTNDTAPKRIGECTTSDGVVVGKMSSLAAGVNLPGSVALAMIKRDYAIVGNSVLAEGASWTILRHA